MLLLCVREKRHLLKMVALSKHSNIIKIQLCAYEFHTSGTIGKMDMINGLYAISRFSFSIFSVLCWCCKFVNIPCEWMEELIHCSFGNFPQPDHRRLSITNDSLLCVPLLFIYAQHTEQPKAAIKLLLVAVIVNGYFEFPKRAKKFFSE